MDIFKFSILFLFAGTCIGRHLSGKKTHGKADIKSKPRSDLIPASTHDTHLIHHTPVYQQDEDNEGVDVKAYRTPHGIDLHIMVQDVVDDNDSRYGNNNFLSDKKSNGTNLQDEKSGKASEAVSRSGFHRPKKDMTTDKQASKKQYAPIAPRTVDMATGGLDDDNNGHEYLSNDEGYLVNHEDGHKENHGEESDGDEQANVRVLHTPHGIEWDLDTDNEYEGPGGHHLDSRENVHFNGGHGQYPISSDPGLLAHENPIDADSNSHEPIGHAYMEEEHHQDEDEHEHDHEEEIVPQHDDMHIVVEQPVPLPPVVNVTKIEPQILKVEFLAEGVGTDMGEAKTKKITDGEKFVGKKKQTNVKVVPAASTSSLVQNSNKVESNSLMEQGTKKENIKRHKKHHHHKFI